MRTLTAPSVAKQIATARKAAHMSQPALALACGVHTQTVYRWEVTEGPVHKYPSPGACLALERVLGLSAATLGNDIAAERLERARKDSPK